MTKQESFKCNKCKDIEFIIENNKARDCECKEVRRYERILENSGISEEFRKRTFSNFNPTSKETQTAKKIAMDYIRGFEEIRASKNNSVAFIGNVGTGKTHLTLAISNNLMKKNIAVKYMQYREDIPLLKQNMIDEEYYQNKMNGYKGASVLLIDDLFKGKINETDLNIMFEIINYRYLTNLPVLISTEFNVDRLLDFDEAVGSRIIEMCKGRLIEFTDTENYRLR